LFNNFTKARDLDKFSAVAAPQPRISYILPS